MAEKESPNKPKDLIEATPEEVLKVEKEVAKAAKKEKEATPEETLKVETKVAEAAIAEKEKSEDKDARKSFDRRDRRDRFEKVDPLTTWVPKTALGKLVQDGKEKDFDKLLSSGRKILEPEVADTLLTIETDLLLIGQAKGKFGGGKRRAWRQTQKKTKEGNVVTFSAMGIAGDKSGRIGIGYGRAKETLPARAKAFRSAKLNIIKIVRGFESPTDTIPEPHTVPFTVEGKCGSCRIKLIPAPRGTGLVVGNEMKKILRLAGIKDVYGVSSGHIRTTFNMAKACIDALNKTNDFIK